MPGTGRRPAKSKVARRTSGGEEVDLSGVFARTPVRAEMTPGAGTTAAGAEQAGNVESRIGRLEGLLEECLSRGVMSRGKARSTKRRESSSGSSRGRSVGSSASGSSRRVHGSRGERQRYREVQEVRRRTEYLTRTPLSVICQQMESYRSMRARPFANTAAAERVAPTWLPMAGAGGHRLRDYSTGVRAAKQASSCKAFEVHTLICAALDDMLLYDKIDVVNSAGCEALIRYCHGLEEAFADVTHERQWKKKQGHEKELTVKWAALTRFNVLQRPERGRAACAEGDPAGHGAGVDHQQVVPQGAGERRLVSR